MKGPITVLVLLSGLMVIGCGSSQSQDLSKVESQPDANLEAGKNASTIEQWSAANPNNGAPGSGEGGDK